MKESGVVDSYQIVPDVHDRTLTLDKYERLISEMMVTSIRLLKQEWPMKTSQSIRAVMLEKQQHLRPLAPVLGKQSTTITSSRLEIYYSSHSIN